MKCYQMFLATMVVILTTTKESWTEVKKVSDENKRWYDNCLVHSCLAL